MADIKKIVKEGKTYKVGRKWFVGGEVVEVDENNISENLREPTVSEDKDIKGGTKKIIRKPKEELSL